MDRIKKAYRSTKTFVEDHKVGITFVATALLVSHNARKSFAETDAWLKEKGLYEEYMDR